MAYKNELMAAGTPWGLAAMLGSDAVVRVAAAGSSVADATELGANLCRIHTSGPGQGVALDYARASAITALYNEGPDAVLVYPAPSDTFNDLAIDGGVVLGYGGTFIAVPSGEAWVVGVTLEEAPAGGGMYVRIAGGWAPLPPFPEAPGDGQVYGRQLASWVALPLAPTPPLPPLSVTAGGAVTVADGVYRVYVNVAATVSLTLPHNDCTVMDRSGAASAWPITCLPPAGATINGAASWVIVNDWQAVRFLWDGANFGL
jgi:hypothetical protein